MTDASVVNEFLDYLNFIHHISAIDGIKKTQDVINDIAVLLQYKYSRDNELVSLRKELLINDMFVDLFIKRFGNKLQFIKNIKESTTFYSVPGCTILAFIENALFNGLVPKEGDWELTLLIDETEDTLLITIKDNGIGYNPSELLNEDNFSENSGTINSISTLLKNIYSNSGELHISSSKGKGTTVNIILPKIA